ncbi:MAG: hypothetical protein WBA77_04035 [Microcoleaceae cyanobacterium]
MGYIVGFSKLDFERIEYFKSRGFNPKCIFDVGASNGGWSNNISPLFPEATFYLFEPLADIEEDYQEKLSQLLESNLIL